MWIKFTFMGDVGFLRRALKWLKFQKQTTVGTQVAVSCFRERFVFLIDRYSPQVSRWSMNFGKLIFRLMLRWRDCVVRGFKTPVSLGSTALFVSLWSCFLILTSTACLVYVLLSLGAAVAFVTIFGHTTELFIVGLFGLLILWKYSNLWTSVILLIVGGVMFSLRNALFLVLTSATYALYCVHNRVGWTGDLLVLSFSFISNDLLNKLLLRYDCTCEGEKLEEQKTSEPILEDFHDYFKYFPSTVETCYADSSNSPVNASVTSDSLHVQNDTSCSKAVRTDLVSREEIKRIMNSSSHYDALGFAQRSNIDQIALKKEYYKKAMLVHPDKNMGNPLASESFKKLQDFTKKKNYDEQLRKEEASRVAQRSCGASRQV
ncbi:hypothetical protein AXF42_Ash018312 [Apostasia shenzhenica]|uniref:J domain-containing protein n=1 Tax=Apostasia shenzhenica TaxID=1088818 RepID=A0A2H9ZR45_9ASPA|nr:hypothetical protein AXF42_Ash018312 [Apostasia shenzhenica]